MLNGGGKMLESLWRMFAPKREAGPWKNVSRCYGCGHINHNGIPYGEWRCVTGHKDDPPCPHCGCREWRTGITARIGADGYWEIKNPLEGI